MRITKRLVIISAFIFLSGCATSPDKMASAYVSPMQYSNFDCSQVAVELQRVTRRANELHGQLDKTASDDAAQMAVGMILFWPTLFFLEGGDGPQAAEYSRLKGERDALEQVALEKRCDPRIIPVAAPPAPPKKDEPSRGGYRQKSPAASPQPYPTYPAYPAPPQGYYYPPPGYAPPPQYQAPPPDYYPPPPAAYPPSSYQPVEVDQPDYRPPTRRTNKPD